jgi:hypothetical protein
LKKCHKLDALAFIIQRLVRVLKQKNPGGIRTAHLPFQTGVDTLRSIWPIRGENFLPAAKPCTKAQD